MASSAAMAGFYSHHELTGRRWLGEISPATAGGELASLSMRMRNNDGGRRFGTVGQRRR
jgi:hypothetical protein